MGKPTGFLEIERHDRPYEKVEARKKSWKEFVKPLPPGEVSHAGRALHGLRHSVLPLGLPGQQSDPGLEQPGLSRPVASRARNAAFDQQFPGIHRPHLPGAVRGGLHAQHRRQSGHDQDDRMRDRRSRLGGRLDPAADPRAPHRQEHRRRGLRAGRHGLRAAARARRPRRHVVRKARPRRRPAALRHSRFQDGKAARSTGACARWRRKASKFRTGVEVGVDAAVQFAAGRLRRGGADRRRRAAARS